MLPLFTILPMLVALAAGTCAGLVQRRQRAAAEHTTASDAVRKALRRYLEAS